MRRNGEASRIRPGSRLPPSRTHSACRLPEQPASVPPTSAPSGIVPNSTNRIVATTRPRMAGGQYAWRKLPIVTL